MQVIIWIHNKFLMLNIILHKLVLQHYSQSSSEKSSSLLLSFCLSYSSLSNSFQEPFLYKSIASNNACHISLTQVGWQPICRFGAPDFLNSFNWSAKAFPLRSGILSFSRIRSNCASCAAVSCAFCSQTALWLFFSAWHLSWYSTS